MDRCVLALINEGARLLEEGIALRASDIDIVYLNGYAFPAWRGGPMFYADTIGLDRVLARLEEFEARHGCGVMESGAAVEAVGRQRKDVFQFRSGGSCSGWG